MLGLEEEALGPTRDVDQAALMNDRVAEGGQRAPERDTWIELAAVLIEEHDLEILRVRDRARVGRVETGQNAQERRLAAAVGSQKAEALPRCEDQVKAADDLLFGEAPRHGLGHQQSLGLALGACEVDADRRAL